MGLFEFIAKPSGAISLDLVKIKQEIIDKVVSASRANVHKLQINTKKTEGRPSETEIYSKIESNGNNKNI